MLGLGGQQILFRFYNDYWMSREADQSPILGGSLCQKKLRRKVMRTISRSNLMGKMGLVPYGKIGCVMLKQDASSHLVDKINDYGWRFKILPVNPFVCILELSLIFCRSLLFLYSGLLSGTVTVLSVFSFLAFFASVELSQKRRLFFPPLQQICNFGNS